MGNRLRIINICRYFTLIFPCKVAEHIFVTLFSCSKSHDLIRILTEPKSAIVKQYQKLLELDGVKLEFDRDALTAIAETTLKRKTGARGLRAIMEKIMMDTMFRVPSDETIKECRITKETVLGTGEPLYLRDGEERRSFLTSESA